jgi:Na+-translocating ferredoxin:NAD+ oxidoreductase subunit G
VTDSNTNDSLSAEEKHPAMFNAGKLGLFAVVAAFILGGTYSSTADRIAASELEVEQRALLEVVELLEDKDINLEDRIAIEESDVALLNLESGESIQVVRNSQNNAVAFILPSIAPDGYSGEIKLLLGIDRGGEITGVRVIEHRETPGLGDKVDIKKSDWILGFNNKSLSNPEDGWAVTKDGGDFDAFTGATITPRAVVNQIYSTLLYYQERREDLVEKANIALEAAMEEAMEEEIEETQP